MRNTIDMAREAELICSIDDPTTPWTEGHDLTLHLKAFEALVRADEREKAIALQQHEDVLAPIGNSAWGEAYQEGWAEGTAAYRDAIRARGEAK
jgi:hypothetical protein